MKKLFFFLVLLTVSYNYAQDLRKYIPNDAVFVGSINGKNILESVTINELDNSKIGKQILQKVSNSTKDSIRSFSEFDINTNGESYFFYTTNDSIAYLTVLLPLKSNTFFEKNIDGVNLTDNGSFKIKQFDSSKSDFMAWDNEKVAFTAGTYNYSYFTDYDFTQIEEELKSQQAQDSVAIVIDPVVSPVDITKAPSLDTEYGYGDVPYFKNYKLENYAFEYHYLSQDLKNAIENNNTSDLATTLKVGIDNINSYISQIDSIQESDAEKLDNYIKNKEFFLKRRADSISNKKDKKAAHQIIANTTFYSTKFKIYPNVADEYGYDYNYNDYYNEKQELQQRWTLAFVESLMVPAKRSILLNKNYLDQLDKNAEMNIWSENYMTSYMQSIGSLYQTLGLSNNRVKNVFSDYGDLSGNLYLNTNEAKFNLDVALRGDLLEITKNISNHKINPKFFNYINEDKFIGYLSYNVDMENVLKEYPKLITNLYSSILYDKTEEIKIVTEFMELLLDEKAIADLIEGDAVFLLSDITEKEVTYTDYEYDENYNSTEVQKTKMETVPDFMFMMTSEEVKFKNSLINYLLNKQYIKQIGGYYQITDIITELPVGVYFANKNGIFFLTTSENDIKNIVANTYQAKMSSSLKKDIKNSQYAAYFNGKKFSSEVKLQSFTDKMAKKLLDNATNFKITSGLKNNDKVHTELIMEVPSGKENALKYVLDLFDDLID